MTQPTTDHHRSYSPAELAALRSVTRREWPGSGDPDQRGPAQGASGDYWPTELHRIADSLESLVPKYRLAADALRREIAADPRCRS